MSSPRISLCSCFVLAALLADGCYSGCPAGTVMVGAACQKSSANTDSDASPSSTPEHPSTEADAAAQEKPSAAMSEDAGAQRMSHDAGASQAPADTGAGMSADAGAASTSQATPVSTAEVCAAEGGLRCSLLGGGKREKCSGGHWMSTEGCASGEACVNSASGQTACMAMLELCKGSGGNAVCDPMGTLYVCNTDATVSHQEVCASARLCQASIAHKSCLMCTPQLEHKCEGKTLEVCSADGTGWEKLNDCDTEALCNATLGMCTAAVCEPGKFVCEKNALKKCNASGTGFEGSPQDCGADTCDAEGGQCDSCEPGVKSCAGDMLMTCNPDGQGSSPTPCPGGMKCVGAGQCVACSVDSECGGLSQSCKVGVCSNYSCAPANAPNGQACSLSSGAGSCQGGVCTCVPKCDKPCGDSGCPGQPCPNKCGSKMCYHDACVDCVTSADCSSLNDDCNAGTCSAGRCVATPQNVSCRDSHGAPSRCVNGSCPTCAKSCSGKCGGESDGCGGTCPNPCGAGTTCSAGKCLECTPGQTGCQGNLSDGSTGYCLAEQSGCFYAWTQPTIVYSAVCDPTGHWQLSLCQGQCDLPARGITAYECAVVSGRAQCIPSGVTCPVQP